MIQIPLNFQTEAWGAWVINMNSNLSVCTSKGNNNFWNCLLTISAITFTASNLLCFQRWKLVSQTHTDTPFSTPGRQLEVEWGELLVIRLSFPLVDSVIPESLCEGAKWFSRRQNVGSSHASEVVSPAGEGGDPGRTRQGENKHGAETRQWQQNPADECSYTVN